MADETPGAGADEGNEPAAPEREGDAGDEAASAPSRKSSRRKKAAGAGGGAEQTPNRAQRRTAATAARADAAVERAAAEGPDAAAGPTVAAPPEAGAVTAVTHVLAPVGRVLASRRAPRIRTGISIFLVIVSVLAVMVSTVALWSRDIIFNTDMYVKVVAPVAEDPQVREAVSKYVAARAIEATDLSARIEKALPADAKVLAAPLTASLQRYLVDEIDRFLGTTLAQRLWIDSNRFAHKQLITALQDKNRYVTVGRDDVRLNLLPLVAVALQKLETRIPQLLGRDVRLPQIDPATAPDEIRTLLQDALGRPLPADFGSITVLRGSQGYEAKRALRLFNDLVHLLVVLTVVLVVAAILISVRRWRTALWLGLGSLLAFVAARVVEVQLEKAIAGAVKTQGGAAVARSIVNSAISSLNTFFVWIAVAGVIVAVAAFLAGRPAWLDAMGRGFGKLFGVASDLSAPDTGAGRWMAAHLDVLRVGGVAVAVVVLLVVAGSLSAVLVTVVALVVYVLALTAYAVGVPRETEDGPPDGPAAPAA